MNSGQSVGAVAILQSISFNFESTIISADSLSAAEVMQQVTVLVTIGILALSILLSFFCAQVIDEKDDFKESLKTTKDIAERSRHSISKFLNTKAQQKSLLHQMLRLQRNKLFNLRANSDLLVWEESTPRVFSSKQFSEKLLEEMKHHHKWFSVAFHYCKSFPRHLRVLALSTKILVMLFFQSLTYDYTNPDDLSCERQTSQAVCLFEKSPFGTGENKCSWKGNSCSFVQPSNSIRVILYVSVFSTLLSVPIDVLLGWVIMKILGAPLKTSSVAQTPADDDHSSQTTPADSEIIATFHEMNQKLQNYRLTLESDLRDKFDCK